MLKKIIPHYLLAFAICAIALTIPTVSSAQKLSDSKVVPGDTLIINIPAEQRLCGIFVVDEQGRLHLPSLTGINIGSIVVAGLTIKQIEDEIARKVSEYYTNNDVTVSMTSSSKYVSIYGRVAQPGAFQYKDDMRILDLFVEAGTIAEDADLSKITLYRTGSDPQFLDVTDLIGGLSDKNNFSILPGDYIIVSPLRSIQQLKVIALGSVGNPGSVLVKKGAKLMDVFAEAKGSVGRAGIGKTYVIRMVDNKPQIIHCDLKALISKADMSQNIEMMDGDIMFVPGTEKVDVMRVITDVLDITLLKNTLQSNY